MPRSPRCLSETPAESGARADAPGKIQPRNRVVDRSPTNPDKSRRSRERLLRPSRPIDQHSKGQRWSC